ncbi:MAG: IS1634 family transposase [Candidatus Dormibacteria bacterium]
MYVARIPNRGSPPAILLRESYREAGKVKNRTLANLTRWPDAKIDALERVLKGLPPRVDLAEAFSVARSLPHGHVAAVLGTAERLGLAEVLDPAPSRARDLAMALIAARVVAPAPKLATARGLRSETASSSLGQALGVSGCDEDDLYAAMDWLVDRQQRIEDTLAARHLAEGTLVLYDVSSAAFEGVTCPLARLGYARDGVRGRLQVVYGMLTSKDGIPVAVEVFEGNTADPATVAHQVAKVRDRFALAHVVLVGDRGMLTKARIDADVAPAGLEWVTALRAPSIKALAADGTLQLSLFDETDLAEIAHPDYPGERLVVCRNPALAAKRTATRQDLLTATEAELDKIVAATTRERRPLRGKAEIGVRVGKVIGHYKMAKHFVIDIAEDTFTYRRDDASIAAEAALDGIYVLRTNVAPETLDSVEVVGAYKALAGVERVFRIFNGDLDVRPIHHRKADRVRAHFFLCMLAHYLEWHLLDRLAPMLFVDDDKAAARAARTSPVAPAGRSPSAKAKDATKHTADGDPVHSLATLLADLATICLNRIQPVDREIAGFEMVTTPTAIQRRAFELLQVSPRHGIA